MRPFLLYFYQIQRFLQYFIHLKQLPQEIKYACRKTFFIIPTDAHYYNYAEILKQFKSSKLAPICFGSRRNHHQGAVLCSAKTTDMVLSVLVDMNSVNVMAAYRPVEQACQFLLFSTVNARLLNRSICRQSID
jgi:hypothetical protein